MAFAITVVPAYGRDYTSAKKVKEDWNAGKDFIVQDISSPHNGRYINNGDAKNSGIKRVSVRYKQLREITIIPVK